MDKIEFGVKPSYLLYVKTLYFRTNAIRLLPISAIIFYIYMLVTLNDDNPGRLTTRMLASIPFTFVFSIIVSCIILFFPGLIAFLKFRKLKTKVTFEKNKYIVEYNGIKTEVKRETIKKLKVLKKSLIFNVLGNRKIYVPIPDNKYSDLKIFLKENSYY